MRIGLAAGAVLLIGALSSRAADWSWATLFDAERTGMLGKPTGLNNWGGVYTQGNIAPLVRDTDVFRSGAASIRADLGTINPGGIAFFQAAASSLASQAQRQVRDLTRYDAFEGYIRNDAEAPLNLRYEIKDYRDSNAHRASYNFTIPAGGEWTRFSAPLDLSAPGWVIDGSPDLSRTYITGFVFSPVSGSVSGSVNLDDFKFHEAAGAIDPQTAPIAQLAERLAERQFSGLWSARNRTTGLIYNTSDSAGVAAMNTTGGVLWMLPSAVRRGWVSQADADAMAARVAASLNTNMNATSYLPTRFIHPSTAAPSGAEESSIDASFILLALQKYKTLPTTSPELAASLHAVAERFQLDAFDLGNRFRMAYNAGTGFSSATYDGYTNEGKVISLAAETLVAHHVPLESNWNGDSVRTRTFLVNADDAHLVHAQSAFRAPFEQALLNLFVDVSDRGVDNYPQRSLATNPWENYVRYERETAARLQQLGRDLFFQPDAGFGLRSGGNDVYQQFSMYNSFGQPTLFMPWSVSLALLAGAPNADEALRALMSTDVLNSPLGLADSARWEVGAEGPTNIPQQQDNWNMVLSTMALLEFIDGANSESRYFAALANIDAALDNVFIDGDVNGDGVANLADLTTILANFGDLGGATPANGDADGDGAVDGADLLRWQRGLALTSATALPEPGGLGHLLVGIGSFSLHKRLSRTSRRPRSAWSEKNSEKSADESACISAPRPL